MRMHSGAPELVSVVIPVGKDTKGLKGQLKALAAQDYCGRWSVIVSDNGPTPKLIDDLVDVRAATGLNVTYVDSSRRKGAAHARNAGVAATGGDFIAFTDSDDQVRPGWLSALVATAANADLVSGAVEVNKLNPPHVVRWRPLPAPNEGWPVKGWYATAIGTSLGTWREVHDYIGGFDERFVVAGEDNDYAWRAQLAGYILHHNPHALVDYRLRDSYSALWTQMYGYGRAAVSNYIKHRHHGLTGYNKPLLLPLAIITLALRNPLLPSWLTRLDRGRWVYYVAHEAGKIHESIARRTLCV